MACATERTSPGFLGPALPVVEMAVPKWRSPAAISTALANSASPNIVAGAGWTTIFDGILAAPGGLRDEPNRISVAVASATVPSARRTRKVAAGTSPDCATAAVPPPTTNDPMIQTSKNILPVNDLADPGPIPEPCVRQAGFVRLMSRFLKRFRTCRPLYPDVSPQAGHNRLHARTINRTQPASSYRGVCLVN